MSIDERDLEISREAWELNPSDNDDEFSAGYKAGRRSMLTCPAPRNDQPDDITSPPAANIQEVLVCVDVLWKNVERALRELTAGYNFDYSATKHALIEAHALCRPLWDKLNAILPSKQG